MNSFISRRTNCRTAEFQTRALGFFNRGWGRNVPVHFSRALGFFNRGWGRNAFSPRKIKISRALGFFNQGRGKKKQAVGEMSRFISPAPLVKKTGGVGEMIQDSSLSGRGRASAWYCIHGIFLLHIWLSSEGRREPVHFSRALAFLTKGVGFQLRGAT